MAHSTVKISRNATDFRIEAVESDLIHEVSFLASHGQFAMLVRPRAILMVDNKVPIRVITARKLGMPNDAQGRVRVTLRGTLMIDLPERRRAPYRLDDQIKGGPSQGAA